MPPMRWIHFANEFHLRWVERCSLAIDTPIAPAVPIGAALIAPWFGCAFVPGAIASDHFVTVEHVEIGFCFYRKKFAHVCLLCIYWLDGQFDAQRLAPIDQILKSRVVN